VGRYEKAVSFVLSTGRLPRHRNSLVGTALLLSMLLCGNAHAAQIENEGVIHTVFLWLKKPGNEQHRHQLLLATNRLRTIPGVLDIRFGEKIASDRDIVDDSFDVGIYVYFSDMTAMQHYLVHPLHQAVVAQDIRPLVKRILVYDFSDVQVR